MLLLLSVKCFTVEMKRGETRQCIEKIICVQMFSSLFSPWHFFSTSMIISTRLILVDNWNIIGPELEEKGSPTISRWFLVIVVSIGNRLVTNVLVGLMIESVSSANDEFLKEKREEKLFRHQLKREELSQSKEKRNVVLRQSKIYPMEKCFISFSHFFL